MLIGPSPKPALPRPPVEQDGIPGILQYLHDLDRALGPFLSQVVTNTVGVIGLRGLSTTGTRSENLARSLSVGGQTSVTWAFSNVEPDASYLVLYAPSVNTGLVFTGPLVRTTTSLQAGFNPQAPSGILLDVIILR